MRFKSMRQQADAIKREVKERRELEESGVNPGLLSHFLDITKDVDSFTAWLDRDKRTP